MSLEIIISFVLGIIGSWLVSLFFAPLTADFFNRRIVRLLGHNMVRTSRSIAGLWYQCWQVESDNFPPINSGEANIRQFLSWVSATYHSEESCYHLIGRIDQDRFITGQWFGDRCGDYHGTFQLHITPKGDEMKGIWLGYDSKNNVQAGKWNWKRKKLF